MLLTRLMQTFQLFFVPPAFAADAIMEAADAGIKVIITITEGIPVKDMVSVKKYLEGREVTLVGPNCPGVITPGEAKSWHHAWLCFQKRQNRNCFKIRYADLRSS